MSVQASTLLLFYSILALVLQCQLGQCNQQRQQQQQQPQLVDQSQTPTNSFSAGEFSALIADGYPSPPAYSMAGKRARKMSAFMPMRGRKDGRDELMQQAPDSPDWPLNQPTPASLYHEATDNPDASILRLVGGAARWPSRAQRFLLGRNLEEPPVLEDAGIEPLMMQAKPRRAFHPMRGKKSAIDQEISSAAELLFDEVA